MRERSLQDLVEKLQDRIEALEAADTEVGDEESTILDDITILNMTGNVSYYKDSSGYQRGRINWGWDAPAVLDDQGQPDPDLKKDPVVDYRAGTILSGSGSSMSFKSTKNRTYFISENHPINATVICQVYAVTKSGIKGPISETSIVVSKDSTAPTTPSTPTLAVNRTSLMVTWDGKNSVGGYMSSDLLYVEVEVNSGSGWVVQGQLPSAGVVTIPSLYGLTYQVRLRAFDKAQNGSTYSATATITLKIPAVPTGGNVTSTVYLNIIGQPAVTVSASCNAVTTAVDGSAITVSAYELWGQRQGQAPTAPYALITSSSTTTMRWQPFEPGESWKFKIRCISSMSDVPSDYTAEFSVTTGTDTTAPNPPSLPVVTSRMGTLNVSWDGKDNVGGVMPVDFKRCDIHASITNNFTPSVGTLVGTLIRAGFEVIPGLTYGTPYYVKLVAYDISENASTPSAQASATIVSVVTNDIVSKAITNVLLDDNAVTAPKIAAGAILASNIAITDWQNYVPNGDFRNGLSGWSWQYAAPTIVPQTTKLNELKVVSASGNNADVFVSTAFSCSTGQQFYVQYEIYAYSTNATTNAVTVNCYFTNGSDGSGGAWADVYASGLVANTWVPQAGTITVPTGKILARPGIAVINNGTVGNQYLIRNIRFYKRNAGELIVDGAITTEKILADQIESGHIKSDAIVASKISVGGWSPNLVKNGGFEDQFDGWIKHEGVAGDIYVVGVGSGVPRSGGVAAAIKHTTVNYPSIESYSHIPVYPSRKYSLRATVCNGDGLGGVAIRLAWYDGNKALLTYTEYVWENPGGAWIWKNYAFIATPISTAKYARVQIYNTNTANNPATIYIDDVSLTEAIVGELIVDGAIDGKTITGGTINGGTITGVTINGTVVNGGTITGGTIGTAVSGSRVVMSGNKLTAIASTNETVTIDPASWSANTPVISINGGTEGEMLLGPNSIEWNAPNGVAQIYLTENPDFTYECLLNFEHVKILEPSTSTSTANGYLWSDGAGNRKIVRSTSLAQYKILVTDLDKESTKFLKLNPRKWFDRGEVIRRGLNPDTVTAAECRGAGLKRIPGFVAEEVEAILPQFCTYDENGGNLTGVAYDRLTAGLLLIAQEQDVQIKTQQAQITALEARLSALESAI